MYVHVRPVNRHCVLSVVIELNYYGTVFIMYMYSMYFTNMYFSIIFSGLGTGIYTTNSAEACQYVADNCQANIIVVENKTHLNKIVKVWDKLPFLKAIVQYSGKLEEKRDNVYTVSYFTYSFL